MSDESKIEEILRAAISNAQASGSDVGAIRRALGLGEDENVLHVERAVQNISIDTPGGTVAFVQDLGPSWVQYKDHRSPAKWEEQIVLPEIPDTELPVRFTRRVIG